MEFTPKQRMLNAYRGIFSDRYPVAPEFWSYYPAKLLGLTILEMEQTVPQWQALKYSFEKFQTEGWGAVGADIHHPDVSVRSSQRRVREDLYEWKTETKYGDTTFVSLSEHPVDEPAWATKYMVDSPEQLKAYVDMALSEKNIFDFTGAQKAHDAVGESFLLEMSLGYPFFDFVSEAMGFEPAIEYFMEEEESVLENYRRRYEEYQLRLIDAACERTDFESFFIGCMSSCNSLLGPKMWRKYDKPGLMRIARRIHEKGKLLHVHFHGRSIDTVQDFAEIGIDCVCPFERGPGGDVSTLDDMRRVRELLSEKVTFNGNVHTIETLIRGVPEDVRREVKEIKTAFSGSPRLIIGTGDQVGRETPEENLWAMIEEAKKQP